MKHEKDLWLQERSSLQQQARDNIASLAKADSQVQRLDQEVTHLENETKELNKELITIRQKEEQRIQEQKRSHKSFSTQTFIS